MRFFDNPFGEDGNLKQEKKKERDDLARLQLLSEVIPVLFLFLHEFTLDIAEINADRFKDRLRQLEVHFNDEINPKSAAGEFKRTRSGILDHIERQKTYLEEREAEFREIIDLMTAAMTGMNSENIAFYSTIRSQGERFEEITLLDDIKRMKNELVREVDHMREVVRHKERQDQSTFAILTNQVESLQKELVKARECANTDSLTGVRNRKALDEYLHQLVDRNRVSRTPFSLLMMDLDDFKRLNDTFGHTVGDRMLLAFAQKCQNMIRGDDFLSRYGGEEFTLILPGASLKNAIKKAKHLCRTISGSRYAADDSPNADAISVTVSIGVSCYRKGDRVKDLLERADQCLYKAKAAGKNRVVAENSL